MLLVICDCIIYRLSDFLFLFSATLGGIQQINILLLIPYDSRPYLYPSECFNN